MLFGVQLFVSVHAKSTGQILSIGSRLKRPLLGFNIYYSHILRFYSILNFTLMLFHCYLHFVLGKMEKPLQLTAFVLNGNLTEIH